MDIPQELKEAIENVIIREKYSNIINESQSISRKYRENKGKGEKLVTKQTEAIAYAISRMPATYCVVYSILSKILKNNNFNIKTVFDVGAGTGSATWAINSLIETQQITCLEREKVMRDIGSRLMKECESFKKTEWKEFDITKDEINQTSDLVVTSYVINELKPEDRRNAIKKMWNATNQILLIIEPGTPEGFKHIFEARNILLAENAEIISPCPHNEKCPINPETDWCSFYVRVSRNSIQRQAKNGKLGYEDEKFSYIAVSKTPIKQENSIILRHPQIAKGYVKVKLCTKNGIEEKRYSKKDKEMYKKVRKLDAGDTI